MTRGIINALVVLAALLLLGVFVWPTRYRYDHINLHGKVRPVRVDRLTGTPEMLSETGWHKMSASAAILPADALAKIDVQIKTAPSFLDTQSISCEMYNGSDWTVQNVDVEITVQDVGGRETLSRRFRLAPETEDPEPIEVLPFTHRRLETDFGFTLKKGESIAYRVVSAMGTDDLR